MKSKRILPVMLAVVIQVMPMLRAVLPVSSQAFAPSAWAIVLKLAGGTVALLGSYHAVSGATAITTPYTVTAGVGVPYIRQLFTSVRTAASWSASTAPLHTTPAYPLMPGLWLTNLSGRIAGIPTAVGTSNITISAWENANNSGGVVGSLFTFTVTNTTIPANISSAPTNQFVPIGANTAFSVAAYGAIPLSYRWQLNGADIPGATNSTISVPRVQQINAGTYTVIVTNPFGSATNSATLTIDTTPATITSAFNDQSVIKGTNVTLSITAAGAPPLSYRWQLNGADVPGGTNATLSLPTVQTNSAGTYTITVTNLYGSASKSATLAVHVTPTITTQILSQTVPLGADVTFTVAATGDPPFTYYWRFKSIYIASATNATYQLFNVQLTNAGNYQAIVSNLWGGRASTAILTVNATPEIIQPPATQTVTAGDAVTLNVTATGTPVLRYQWQYNRADITDATNASLAISSFQTTNEGYYRVVVSNDLGTATSSDARVAVGSPPHFGLTQPLPGGGLQLEYITLANKTISIQGTTNMLDWQPLITTNSGNGYLNVNDPAPTNSVGRLYRGVE